MFTFMAQFKRDQKIIIFSDSLALTIFQPRGPVGLAEGAGLSSSIHTMLQHSRAIANRNKFSMYSI